MKKQKMATPAVGDFPRTSKEAMAPAAPPAPERSEEDKVRDGGYDLDHLMRAEEIKADPDKMAYVMKAHAKKTTAMRSIADLKNAGQALAASQSKAVKSGDESVQGRVKQRYPKDSEK